MTRVKTSAGAGGLWFGIFGDQLRGSSDSITLVFALLVVAMITGCAMADRQPLLKIASGAVPGGTMQSAYQTTLAASGGTPPYVWKIQSGQIPPGLSLDSRTGIIVGTPTKSGHWDVVFAVSDHFQPQPETSTASFAFEISTSVSASLTVAALALPNGQISQTYQATVTAAGGTSPYSWSISSGSLPPGLGLAPGGEISGAPTASGDYPFTLKVTDSGAARQSATQANAIVVNNTLVDQYGGFVNMASPNPPTGMFRTEKFGNKWMLVDPDNNGFFMIGMYVLNGSNSPDSLGSNYDARIIAKYGDDSTHWATAQLKRIGSWGYNTVGPYASAYMLPFKKANTWDTPDSTNPVKFPFIGEVRPALYGMQNLNNWAPQPTKDMLFGATKFYTGYRPGNGVADYYDGNLSIFLANQLASDPSSVAMKTSPYKQYVIGMNADDGDEMYGFGNGPDFKTGHSNAHLGWLVLTMSPQQTANSSKRLVYPDTTVYSKKALRDQLAAKYGTVGALNTAWGSNYTTFDSSGSTVSEAIGSGNGSTLSYNHTLNGTVVSAFSLQILVNGQAVGGDQGDGTVWGPGLSGTIDYTTGALNLTFSSSNAPTSGAQVTATYAKNGWGVGSGLLDEDGRVSHQIWTGIDFTFFSDVNAEVKADLDNFLFQIADHYFSMCKTQIQAWMPGVMYFGPDSLGSWGAPSNRNVLKAAAQSIDVIVMSSGKAGLSQEMLDFIFTYYGDKPFYTGEFRVANSDSALFSYTANTSFATQQDRGSDYFKVVTTYPNASYSANGSRPYVGVFWWEYLDNWGEKDNWGLVSLSDNAYDGHEAVIGTGGARVRSVPCSAPLSSFMCGGEERNYGDVISSVRSAHQQMMQAVQQ
jgi:hypothetical protein